MLTINEIIQQKKQANIFRCESIFLETVFEKVLEYASSCKSKGHVSFNDFKSKAEFEFFHEVILEIIENNYVVNNIVTDIEVDLEHYDLEVNFDLQKKDTL